MHANKFEKNQRQERIKKILKINLKKRKNFIKKIKNNNK
jgi:hypothetical protein